MYVLSPTYRTVCDFIANSIFPVQAETLYSHKFIIEKHNQKAFDEELEKRGQYSESQLLEIQKDKPEEFAEMQKAADESDMVRYNWPNEEWYSFLSRFLQQVYVLLSLFFSAYTTLRESFQTKEEEMRHLWA